MSYSTGAKIAADIIDDIANNLIATIDPLTSLNYWSDADTVWNTTVRTGNDARRALKYDNGVETPIYLALEVINQTSGVQYDREGPSYAYWYYYGKGFRAVFSSSWDYTTHTYTGSIQTTFIPFITHNGGIGSDLRNVLVTHHLWIEGNGNGFAIMGKPEPTGESYQQSFIIVVERIPTKEYIDTYSNFFLYTVGNIWAENYDGNYPVSIWRNRSILRPFAFQWPDGGGKTIAFPNGYGISFPPFAPLSIGYIAYKSIGNGKVYYIKPIVNNAPNQLSPIFQSELFFLWSEGLGLIDGDVIAVQGQPIKYLCKAIDSPDSTSRLTYAIKYLG